MTFHQQTQAHTIPGMIDPELSTKGLSFAAIARHGNVPEYQKQNDQAKDGQTR